MARLVCLHFVCLFLFDASNLCAADVFELSVRPTFVESCLRCHGPDKQKGGLRVDSREALLKGGDSGPAVVPGDATASLLFKAINHEADYAMPPSGKLAEAKIEAIASWINSGAKWGVELTKPSISATDGETVHQPGRTPGTITAADRAWWAFQPPRRPEVPSAGDGWARTPIDRFIAERHASEGLAPALQASKQTLIRRVTFDLTGLPPTPEEVEAFLADESSTAYETLVDRLLTSLRYGERQARAWLDLVRYGESDGYRADIARPSAWKYRDYVIRSFNNDKGYDRFLAEQLAGDELAPGDADARIATGFLRHWPYEYNQRDVRGQWAAIQNDVTDVVADVFLGLGMSCARCHDHKFDPILQKDYFALQAFFAGLSYQDEPVFASSQAETEYQQALAKYNAQTAEIQAKIDALLEPIRRREMKKARERFPEDIQAIFNKSRSERTPGEQQLYELANRQVEYEYERAPSKLPADKKPIYAELMKELEAYSALKPASPWAMVARDLGPVAAEVKIPGGRKQSVAVEPEFLTVLSLPQPTIIPVASSTGRRLALARSLTEPNHPLTARVIVNRVWQGFFGTGLVATASDYGTLGEAPSHPELLDWLATEFVQQGWSFKYLQRLIVTSAVYRQASVGAAKSHDLENKFLARMPVRRLDAEQVRDAMFAVSGELDLTAYGESVPASQPRRSIYTKIQRNAPDPLLASFDAADGLSSCAKRNATVTPTQSLLLLNGTVPLARAQAFAARVMPAKNSPDEVSLGIRQAYLLCYGRPPTDVELARAREFLRQQVGITSGKTVTPESRRKAWEDFCHALLNSNEFLYAD